MGTATGHKIILLEYAKAESGDGRQEVDEVLGLAARSGPRNRRTNNAGRGPPTKPGLRVPLALLA